MPIHPATKELKKRLIKLGATRLSVRRELAAKGHDVIRIKHKDWSILDSKEIAAINSVMGRYAKSPHANLSRSLSLFFYTIEVEMALGFRKPKFVCSCGLSYGTAKEERDCCLSH